MIENYIDRLAAAIGSHCGLSMDQPRERQLLRLYAVLGYSMGPGVDNEAVHDAWSAWRLEDRPDHPSIVPFEDLTLDVQALDSKYRDAIRSALITAELWDPEG